MEKTKSILMDVFTFSLISIAAAIFGFSGIGAASALVGRIICAVAAVLALLAIVVKRPESLSR